MCCPDCGGKLNRRCSTTRKRFLEDIPDAIQPEITGHTIPQEGCPKCRKVVVPVVPDAMPGATIGHRTVMLSAFLHDLVGTADVENPRNFHHPIFFQVDGGRAGALNLLNIFFSSSLCKMYMVLLIFNTPVLGVLYYNPLKFPVSTSVYPLGKRTPVSHCRVFSTGLGIDVK
jgi:hypothetical protein